MLNSYPETITLFFFNEAIILYLIWFIATGNGEQELRILPEQIFVGETWECLLIFKFQLF